VAWQLARAGTSIAANYEEAKGSHSRREFAAKNAIVLKEAREARFWLRIVLACDLASDRVEVQRLYDEADQLVAIFITSVRKLTRPQVFGAVLIAAIVLGLSGLGSLVLASGF